MLSKAVTRFRLPWRWNGGPATLQSRATDDTGYVQPTRAQMIADRGAGQSTMQRDHDLGRVRQGAR